MPFTLIRDSESKNHRPLLSEKQSVIRVHKGQPSAGIERKGGGGGGGGLERLWFPHTGLSLGLRHTHSIDTTIVGVSSFEILPDVLTFASPLSVGSSRCGQPDHVQVTPVSLLNCHLPDKGRATHCSQASYYLSTHIMPLSPSIMLCSSAPSLSYYLPPTMHVNNFTA